DDVPEDDASRTTAVQLQQNDIFYACLRAMTTRKQAVSDAKTAGNYAPKVFARMSEARGMSAADLERTMERLFSAGMIERAQLDFNSGNTRNKAHGLRATDQRGGSDEAAM
ncbi:hypothetical protein, partial [Sphingomonas daechungensis]|uniref:hypothetical protein n=1 Tax=Sphingomonas daechungensis TaxID=1176646 RepID=UPI0037839B9B